MNNKTSTIKNEIVNDNFHKWIHELKNPLTVCNGYLELIPYSDEENKEKYYQIIKQEMKRTLFLLNNYKNQFGIQKEEFDLTMLWEDVKMTLNDFYQKNNSDIILLDKDELYYEGDYEKLKQVFLNLLKNSYEAKSDNKLLIVIDTKNYKSNYEITIIDNGKGMNQKELKKVGEKYFTTKKEGTGLGISFCKDIIKKHGGILNYQSEKNIGTKTTIILPK